jgi:Putative peptidoglycan binding domain
MRRFLVLFCILALACVGYAAREEHKPEPKKKQARPAEHTAARERHPAKARPAEHTAARERHPAKARPAERTAARERHPANVNKPGAKPLKPVTQSSPRPRNLTPSTKPLKPVTQSSPRPRNLTPSAKPLKPVTQSSPRPRSLTPSTKPLKPVTQSSPVPRNLTPSTKPLKPVTPFHASGLNLPNKPNPRIASVKFQQNRRISGSQNWQGKNYWAFRNYRSVWHDRYWWTNHYTRIVLVDGGYYYWNAGFWYPAWGYDPGNAYYPYDGPIYAYNNLPPNQVIGNVQLALQQQGYYHGEVDGLLGPLTSAAITNYQRNHGLYVTSAIDQPTLQSLGMV